MSHTNSTTNYSLPQFLTTDKPAWLTDVNNAYLAIDTAMKNNADAASTADTKATNAGTAATNADTKATAAKTAADGAIASIADAFSDTNTYVLNDIVMYNSLLYKCTTAVTTPGAWTGSANWARITVEEITDALNILIQAKAPIPVITNESNRMQIGPNVESTVTTKTMDAGTYIVSCKAALESTESGKYVNMKLYSGTTLRTESLSVIGAGVYPELTGSYTFTIGSSQAVKITMQHNCSSVVYASAALNIVKIA